jgi:hypothetical protein
MLDVGAKKKLKMPVQERALLARGDRKERRKAKALNVGTVIRTATVNVVLNTPAREQALYWVVVPDGMTETEAWDTQERHGPFKTDADVAENQRLTLLGSQCKVIEGGMWDDAWDKPQ